MNAKAVTRPRDALLLPRKLSSSTQANARGLSPIQRSTLMPTGQSKESAPVISKPKLKSTPSGKKYPTRTKPGPTPEQKTLRYFKSLAAQAEGGHFTNALKTCEKILRINEPASVPEAIRTKIFCLLHLEKYTEALSVLDSSSMSGMEEQGIERAYALYRLGKEADVVLPLLDEGLKPNLGRGGLHLRAQLCYRTGNYEEAVSLYNELLDSCDINSEEYKDIENNLQIVQERFEFERSGFKAGLHKIDVLKLEEMPPVVSDFPIMRGYQGISVIGD